MPEKMKVYEKTAKTIKCVSCGTGMNELKPHLHNSKSMFKLDQNQYLCQSTKCVRGHLGSQYNRYENECYRYC